MSLEIRNIIRDWFISDYEKSYSAISFYISDKPKSRILLSEDKEYDKTFNFHIEKGEDLSEPELDFLVQGIIDFLPLEWNLTTCGKSDPQKLRLYHKFYSKLSDTDCVRIIRDEWDNHAVYLKILKRNDLYTKEN
jgi:hypothetical protein